MAARSRASDLVARLPSGPVRFGVAWLERLLAVQLFDRAVALAGLAFTALIPAFIVYDAVVPTIDGKDFAQELNARFNLSGAAADSVTKALAPPGDVKATFSVLGLLLVVVSALSFGRALQRLYELSFRLPALGGVRGTPSTLLWLALIPAFLTARQVVESIFDGVLAIALDLAVAAVLWTLTPVILLARRLDWRRLWPTGLITALAMSALSVGTVIWMPRAVADSAERYGLIGVAFALVSWLVAAGFTVELSATAGALVAERAWRAP